MPTVCLFSGKSSETRTLFPDCRQFAGRKWKVPTSTLTHYCRPHAYGLQPVLPIPVRTGNGACLLAARSALKAARSSSFKLLPVREILVEGIATSLRR